MRIQQPYNQLFISPYSFQAQEHDDEVKGDGNSVNYKYRMHDPRLGRFFAIDPLSGKFPWNSNYAFSANRVIDAFELEGRESADAKKGANVLVIVVLGYENVDPYDNKTQAKNNEYNTEDISEGSSQVGLSSIGEHFAQNSQVQVVVFSSADNEAKTVKDVETTMHNFHNLNPNGEIILVGHSLGGDNIVNAASNAKDVPVTLLYTIDICDVGGGWDDDNISSNVKFAINVYQENSVYGGEDIEFDSPNKTIGFNHKATEENVTHINVDNMYANKVKLRIERVVNGKTPLTSTEISTIKEARKAEEERGAAQSAETHAEAMSVKF